MAAGAAVALAADLLEDLHLLALAGLDQGGVDHGAFDQRGADDHVRAFADHQHFIESHGRAGVAVELLDDQHVAGLNPVLLTAGLDHRVHRSSLKKVG